MSGVKTPYKSKNVISGTYKKRSTKGLSKLRKKNHPERGEPPILSLMRNYRLRSPDFMSLSDYEYCDKVNKRMREEIYGQVKSEPVTIKIGGKKLTI